MKDDLLELILQLNPRAKAWLDSDTRVDLWETGALDSVAVIELVSLIEKKFNIVFDMSDLSIENFQSIDAICAMLKTNYNMAK